MFVQAVREILSPILILICVKIAKLFAPNPQLKTFVVDAMSLLRNQISKKLPVSPVVIITM